jgi:multiple sugar transport system ATP-binding protein
MASVTYDHVTKRFGEGDAISDLSLEVPDKEFLVLVGPSGCGKSTALRMLAGLERITEGRIFIGDRMVNDVAAKDRDIAMVFQSYALYPHMSVYDNLAFGLSLRKLAKTEIQERVKDAARILEIEPLLDRKPRALSGGQRQRVALGRAIVREPACFLMDEPLSNLDAKLRVQMRAELIRLHERLETTIIYVTHDQVEAMTMGERIAVLNAGVLQQLDTPRNLYNHPTNVFVAGFIGSPAMNFFDAEVVQSDGRVLCRVDGLLLAVDQSTEQALGKHVGTKVVYGIRPEHIADRRIVQQEGVQAVVRARIDVVEHLGNEILLYLMPAGQKGKGAFIARMSAEAEGRPGEELEVVFDTTKAHVFDGETGDAIM